MEKNPFLPRNAASLSNLRARLKTETQEAHEALEGRLDLLSIESLEKYVALLSRFLGYLEPLERTFHQLQHLLPASLQLDSRAKSPRLLSDLKVLGLTPERIASIPRAQEKDLPILHEPADLWGCLYVIEGSTLGGQILSRHFGPLWGLTPERGLSYFSGYGSETSSRWKSYLEQLEAFAQEHPGIEEQVISAASETFELMERWLC